MLVKIIFFLTVGFGALFPTTSAVCGDQWLSCGKFGYPFHETSMEDGDCGYPGLSVDCSSGTTPTISISSNSFYVLNIIKEANILRVVGKDVDLDEGECPRPTRNFTIPANSPYSLSPQNKGNATYFYNCSSGYPKNVAQGLPCLDDHSNGNNTTTALSEQLRSFAIPSYYFLDDQEGYNWFLRNCQEIVVVPVEDKVNAIDIPDLMTALKRGFVLEWTTPDECKACENSGGQCSYDHEKKHACSCPVQDFGRVMLDKVCHGRQGTGTGTRSTHTHLKIILGVCLSLGGLVLPLLFKLIVIHRKFKNKSPINVEAFLDNCGCFGLQRYKYSQVKKMTNTFNEKIGQGGFGSVYKGKLSDGRFVAVKVLNMSKGNGEDFLNEVATIGWTNHVNVVRLLGFCSDGNKHALIYEYMVNGSLEKFIYDRNNISITNPSLGCEKLYQISLGIAKGLEYLHYGCNSRILHFDIKPHNILLDENFCPKISDFGLAKVCQTRESNVSMHVARGTVGYTAPEISCINFGRVSHKSDVYSFGMMVCEMIAGRKNVDVNVENTSEIFFPQWIYNHLKREINIGRTENLNIDAKTRKMIIVDLWCIQTHPSDRPPISKVVEMLEGNVDELDFPPNPFQGSTSSS